MFSQRTAQFRRMSRAARLPRVDVREFYAPSVDPATVSGYLHGTWDEGFALCDVSILRRRTVPRG